MILPIKFHASIASDALLALLKSISAKGLSVPKIPLTVTVWLYGALELHPELVNVAV